MSEIVAEAVRHNLKKAYEDGYTDGVREMIAQLDGTSVAAPDGIYRGPNPLELQAWLQAVKSRLP